MNWHGYKHHCHQCIHCCNDDMFVPLVAVKSNYDLCDAKIISLELNGERVLIDKKKYKIYFFFRLLRELILREKLDKKLQFAGRTKRILIHSCNISLFFQLIIKLIPLRNLNNF